MKMDTGNSLRHEIKHEINASDAFALGRRLALVAKRDPHASQDGAYRVRSLYFDNFQDKALMEKRDGTPRREKFRIRYYDDDLSFIRLEKKSKIDGLCLKDSAGLSLYQCEQLLGGHTQFLLQSDAPLFHELYVKMITQQLRPKTIVDYTRQAFLYGPGNVRVTIDSKIRACHKPSEFLDMRAPTLPAGPQIILEVKYDEFLPQVICDLTQIRSRHATAFSKYAACRN